jgi:hypothetical protein
MRYENEDAPTYAATLKTGRPVKAAAKHPQFGDALKLGKKEADTRVE